MYVRTTRPCTTSHNTEQPPLIGIFLKENDHDVVQYFTEEAQADTARSKRAIEKALSLAGSWSDLDWEDVERELYRIQHESQPTPAISL